MQLIQILLPVADNDGVPFPQELLRGIQAELASHFGGVTAFSRAPAKGIWQQDGARQQDDIIVVEVMAKTLDRDWWRHYRLRLQHLLHQDLIVIRAQAFDML